MHYTASVGNLELIKLLYKKGLSIFACTYDYQVPIHFAARGNNPHVIQWFIDTEPSLIDSRADYNMTPLIVAAGYNSLESMICLIKNGANYKHKNNGYLRAIDILCDENPTYYEEYFKECEPLDSDSLIACLEKLIATPEYKNSKNISI